MSFDRVHVTRTVPFSITYGVQRSADGSQLSLEEINHSILVFYRRQTAIQ